MLCPRTCSGIKSSENVYALSSTSSASYYDIHSYEAQESGAFAEPLQFSRYSLQHGVISGLPSVNVLLLGLVGHVFAIFLVALEIIGNLDLKGEARGRSLTMATPP